MLQEAFDLPSTIPRETDDRDRATLFVTAVRLMRTFSLGEEVRSEFVTSRPHPLPPLKVGEGKAFAEVPLPGGKKEFGGEVAAKICPDQVGKGYNCRFDPLSMARRLTGHPNKASRPAIAPTAAPAGA